MTEIKNLDSFRKEKEQNEEEEIKIKTDFFINLLKDRPGSDFSIGFLILKLHSLKTNKEKLDYLTEVLTTQGEEIRDYTLKQIEEMEKRK